MKILGKTKTPAEIALVLYRYGKVVLASVLAIIPKLIFGNAVGVKNNIVPRLELWTKRAAFDKKQLRLDDKALAAAAELSARGVCIFEQTGESSALEAIKARLKIIYDDPNLHIDSPNRTQRRIINPVAVLPELKTLVSDPVSNAVCAYYGCAFKIFSVQAWRNIGVPCSTEERDRRDLMSNTLHNDYWPVTSLRLFVILSDAVTKETGALRYHDKQTTRATMRSLKYFDRFLMPASQRNALYDPSKLHYFEGRLGDACLVNTQEVLHGSSIPEAGAVRDVVQYLLVPNYGSPVRAQQLFENLPQDPEMLAFLKQAGRAQLI